MRLEGLQVGHYRLLRFIGSGAMGEVYFAEDTRIDRRIAVKVVSNEVNPYPDAQATDDAFRLFHREMKAIAALDHPNILPLFDFGEQTSDKATLTYMVMPFRQEGSLVDWLRQRTSAGLLAPEEVVHIVRQAADALQHAHNRHLMHLDVKPSNFLMRHHEDTSRRPDVLLSDFGISKFNTTTSTASQTIRGTPPYMAPEQWAGSPVAATDQYALAVMAYHLLTRRFPFEGNMQQVMYKHFQERPQPPSAINPVIPPSVDRVILRALEKKPEDRFPSVQAFANAFEQAWQPESARVPPPPPLPPTQYAPLPPMNIGELPPTHYMPPPLPTPSPKKPSLSRPVLIIIGLIILVAIGGLAFALSSHSSSSNSSGFGITPTPTYPQLKSSYSGNYTGTSSNGSVQLFVDSQDHQGSITAARVSFNGGNANYSCTGSVTSDNHITLECSGYGDFTFNFNGIIYSDGHIQGTERNNHGFTFYWNIS